MRRFSFVARVTLFVICLGMLPWIGCGALNPAFVEVAAPGAAATISTVDNAPGHTVLTFVNNATVDERLLSYLESADGGNLVLTDAEKRSLRPRIRFDVVINFANGTQMVVEFVDGSAKLVDQEFDARSEPDLNQNDLKTVVLSCADDIQQVAIAPGFSVFVPVQLNQYRRIDNASVIGQVEARAFELQQQIPPAFRVLQVDELDGTGNVTLQRNFDIRDVPAPRQNVDCGSVIAIVLAGTLDVPFLEGVDDNPSYDGNDPVTVARIGGRYELAVTVIR